MLTGGAGLKPTNFLATSSLSIGSPSTGCCRACPLSFITVRAGTTAASLRAGVPTVVVPFFLDQFYWGRRVFELGVGPKPILRKHLRADSLAAALRQATVDQGMRNRAVALSQRIRAEHGVARAIATFNKHFAQTA